MTFIEILSLMVFAHFLADYPLQGTWIATTKSHKHPHSTGYPWYHSLTAHAVIHGGFVGIITGSVVIACAEVIFHWVIDYHKSNDTFGIHMDQFLHLMCKILWAWVATSLILFGQ